MFHKKGQNWHTKSGFSPLIINGFSKFFFCLIPNFMVHLIKVWLIKYSTFKFLGWTPYPRHKMSTHVYAWTLNYRWTSYISREGNLTPWKRGQGWCCYQLVTKVPTLHNPVRSVGVCNNRVISTCKSFKPYFSSLWLLRCLTFMYTVFPKVIDRLLVNLVFN